MLWSRMLPEIYHFAALDHYPNILVLHAGGNDMAVRASRDIIRDIKIYLLHLWSACPTMIVVVWSDIVARKVWRQARSVDRVNKARVKINKEVGCFVKKNGGVVVQHRDFEESPGEFLWGDGIHSHAI